MIPEEGSRGPGRDAPPLRTRTVFDFMQVGAGDYLRGRVEVSVGPWKTPLAVEWGEPNPGGICRQGEADPIGWFRMPIAGVGRWGTLEPGRPIRVVALVGTSPLARSGPITVPPGVYQVVVPLELQIDGRKTKLTALGPLVRIV